MTRDETKKLLMIIQTAYPTFKPPDKTVAVDLWTAMFADYDFQTVVIAVQAFIASDDKGFAPAIGQIMAKLRMLKESDAMSEMEVWSMVYKAICNSAYHSQEEYDKLPPDAQKCVGSASQLHAWALDEDFNEGVVMSQFLKSYRTVTARREEMEKIPVNIRNMIEDTTKKLEG